MKQVFFALLLLAMVSFTGCLNGDDATYTTYKPSKNSSINIPDNITVTKSGNTLTTDCIDTYDLSNRWEEILISDANSNVIWAIDPDNYFIRNLYVNGEPVWELTVLEYGWEVCETNGQIRLNINLPQEPVRFSVVTEDLNFYAGTF